MKIFYIQHVPFEGPAALEDWAKLCGHELVGCKIYEDAPLLDPSDYDLLVILGGPMGVYDEDKHPWLKKEKEYIKEVISSGKVALGICLGAQLLANVLGAKVKKNIVREIGWFPVSLTPIGWNDPIFKNLPATFDAFHWHGDTFEIPKDAYHIASSHACPNQAFIWDGRVIGLQFHIETKPESVKLLLENCADEIEDSEYCQKPNELLVEEERYKKINEIFFKLMDSLPILKAH